MKRIAFCILTIFCFALSSIGQTAPCGSTSKSGKVYVVPKLMMQQRSINVPYCAKIYVTVFADNDGNNRAATDEGIIAQFHLMAVSYKPLGICFMLMGIREIRNSDLNYQDKSEENELSPFLKAGMLNVFIHKLVTDGTDTIGGTAYDIPNTGLYCSLSNIRFQAPGDNSTMAHEVGHVFGLYHTFEPHPGDPFHGKESVTRNSSYPCYDCDEDGDLICDTPADPDQDGKDVDGKGYLGSHTNILCVYNGTRLDECGTAYQPATNNIMSYGNSNCLDSLTPGQGDRMRGVIENEPDLRACMADDNATFGVPPLTYNSGDNYLNARDQLNAIGYIESTSSAYLQLQAKKIVIQQNMKFSPGAGGRIVLKAFNGCD